MVSTLLDIDENTDLAIKLTNFLAFLRSEYFSSIPYVTTSAGLWAMIKQDIKKQQFLTEKKSDDNIKKEIRGLFLDIEHLSIFAPYCYAVFTDKRIAGFLVEWKKNALSNFKSYIFSRNNIGEFNSYLDDIESNISGEMKEEFSFVYGREIYNKLFEKAETLYP